MIERSLEIRNQLGLHARAASRLVHVASSFRCSIELSKDDLRVEAKSILGVLLLAAPQGTSVTVHCEGDDEQQAIEALEALFERGFDELETAKDVARDSPGDSPS